MAVTKLPKRLIDKIGDTSNCWTWTGAISNDRAYVSWEGRSTQAYRVIYMLLVGPIPSGSVLMHSCDNPLCVNPDHLKPGTQADNLRDAHSKGRMKTGLDHWKAKLSSSDVIAIRNSADLTKEIADKYGITIQYVARLRRGEGRWL